MTTLIYPYSLTTSMRANAHLMKLMANLTKLEMRALPSPPRINAEIALLPSPPKPK
jgi:hypothetical protein